MAEVNPTQLDPFEEDTREALRMSARWLDEHADDLARSFVGGCRDWSVEFTAGQDGLFPDVRVSVCKVDREILGTYGRTRTEHARVEGRQEIIEALGGLALFGDEGDGSDVAGE